VARAGLFSSVGRSAHRVCPTAAAPARPGL
jgi:hypothetical protein